MLRIIGGKFKGRKLAKSDHLKDLRPTKDYVRENIFNILTANKKILETGFSIVDCNVLDVCCGTGAIGFEALSRGAKYVKMIEKNPLHVELVKKNQQILDAKDNVEIVHMDANRLSINSTFFDLIYLDPPYADNPISIVNNLIKNNWLQFGSILVVEVGAIAEIINLFEDRIKNGFIAKKLELLEKRKYGSTVFYFIYCKN